MNLVVFIKQVPDNTKTQVGDDGVIPESAPMMMNPYDEYALETALRLKEASSGHLTVISMGSPSAKEIVKKAVAVGADQAFIVADDALEGSDSSGAAHVLAQAVKTLVPEHNVLVFGQNALDTGSGQTGPKVAELLNIPSLSFCKNAEADGNNLTVSRETEVGTEKHSMTAPAVICMMKCDYELRGSNIKGVMKANKTDIPIKTLADLGVDTAKVGSAGASTVMVKTWKRPAKSNGKVIDGSDAGQAVNELVNYLKESKVL